MQCFERGAVCCACVPALWAANPRQTRPAGDLAAQDPRKPATVDNLVLLTHAEADEHDQLESLDALRQQVGAAAAAHTPAWLLLARMRAGCSARQSKAGELWS